VVLVQRVRPGRENEYLRWQAEINDECRTFPGFEADEVIPPVPGIQDDYVVIYRFDSFPHLDAWLRSDARQALLARSQDVLDESQQQIVAGRGTAQHVSGMVVATRVKPGHEREYRAWQQRIDAEAARFPGFLSNEVFPPVPGLQNEWVVLVRFDSPERLQNWLLSDVRKLLIDEAARLWERSSCRELQRGFPRVVRSGLDQVRLGCPAP
jgi:uncharacterized protein